MPSLVKFNRLVQDKEESIKHLISTYHGLKTEISRLFEDHSTKVMCWTILKIQIE